MAKNQNFKNRSARFVERHTGKVHAKFQIPSMYGVQMNVLFVFLRYRDLKTNQAPLRTPNPSQGLFDPRELSYTIPIFFFVVQKDVEFRMEHSKIRNDASKKSLTLK